MMLTTWFIGMVGAPIAALLVYGVLSLVEGDDNE